MAQPANAYSPTTNAPVANQPPPNPAFQPFPTTPLAKLETGQWGGYTNKQTGAQQSHAQSGEPLVVPPSPTLGDPGSTYVTVPVDKVVVAPTGRASVETMYATPNGYQQPPPSPLPQQTVRPH